MLQPLFLVTPSAVGPAPAQRGLSAARSVSGVEQDVADSGASDIAAAEPTKQAQSASQPDEVDFSQAAQALLELSPEQEEQVKELAARDREVRAHEQAHLAAAGPYARGGPTYTYQTGPDGKNYAIGGQVQIDTSAIPGDPEATARKAQVVRAAALAPAKPSAQDRAVAQAATKMEQQALAEIRSGNHKSDGEDSQDPSTASSTSAERNFNLTAASYALTDEITSGGILDIEA